MPNEDEQQLPTRAPIIPRPLTETTGPLFAKLVEGSLGERQNAASMLAAYFGYLEQRIDGLEKRIDATIELYFGRQEDDMSESLILNVTQTAKMLGISRTTVYKLIQSGALPARKFASSEDADPRIVVLSEDLRTFLANLPSAEGQPAS